ncbi:unnamed protein product [Soboliphyme baturini]|uniref:Uncharacterized protein n=1 Tax=Soboliphyme baturini TaxID=241478 RepID=A0A183J6S2_9BILA|nr:unnamed protein product [Soboliphyme baturini]
MSSTTIGTDVEATDLAALAFNAATIDGNYSIGYECRLLAMELELTADVDDQLVSRETAVRSTDQTSKRSFCVFERRTALVSVLKLFELVSIFALNNKLRYSSLSS